MMVLLLCVVFFFQAEDGIRDLVRSRGLGDVYKRQLLFSGLSLGSRALKSWAPLNLRASISFEAWLSWVSWIWGSCLLYTSDAADERSSVDLGGRRIIKKKKKNDIKHNSNRKESNTNSNTKVTAYMHTKLTVAESDQKR